MAEKTRPKGYVSSVPNTVVPRIYISDEAGAIVGAAGRNLGSAIRGLGSAFQNIEDVNRRAQVADLEADFSNWDFETSQGLIDMDRSSPDAQSNRFEAADAYLQQRQQAMLERVRSVDPNMVPMYNARLTEHINRYRQSYIQNDFERKKMYFTGRAVDYLGQAGKRLAGNPDYLDEAYSTLENIILTVPDEHLSVAEKTQLLSKGRRQLESIALLRDHELELERGPDYVDQNADKIFDRFNNPSRVSSTSLEKMKGVATATQNVYADVASVYGDIGITSGVRSREHNEAVGGATESQHIPENGGSAIDIQASRLSRAERRRLLVDLVNDPRVGGIGLYDTGNIHVDTRPRAAGAPPAIWGAGGSYSTDPKELENIIKTEMGKAPSWSTASGRVDLGAVADRLIGPESGGDPTAKNPRSTARGLRQITNETWMEYMKRNQRELYRRHNGDEWELLRYRNDPAMERDASIWKLRLVANALKEAGAPVNDGTLYLGYFLGEGDVAKVWNAPASDNAADYVSPRSVEKNPEIFTTDGRPTTVAELKDRFARKMGQTTLESSVSSKPQYANVDWETDMQARAQAEANVRSRAAEQRAQATAEKAQALDGLLMDIYTGNAGRQEIDAAVESGRFDYDDIKKMDSALADREKRVGDLAAGLGRLDAGDIWNPDDTDHKNQMNAVGEQLLGKDYEQLNNHNPAALTVLNSVIDRTQGTMMPSDVSTWLKSAMRSRDWKTFKYANDIWAGLNEAYPQLVARELSDDQLSQVLTHAARKERMTDVEMERAAALKLPSELKREMESVDTLTTEYINKYADQDWESVKNEMFDGWFSREPENQRQNLREMAALKADFWSNFREAMRNSEGDVDVAMQVAKKKTEAMGWGISKVTSSGNGKIMRRTPESWYGQFLTPDEMRQDIIKSFDIKEGETFRLVADAETMAAIKAGRKPTWGIVVQGTNGEFRIVTTSDGKNRWEMSGQAEINRRLQIEKNKLEYRNDTLYGTDVERRIGTYDREQGKKKTPLEEAYEKYQEMIGN